MFILYNTIQRRREVLSVMSTKQDGSTKIVDNPVLWLENKQNRRKFFEKIGVENVRVRSAELEHGNNVEVVHSRSPQIVKNCDGLITSDPEIYLSITVADCLPVFFYDPVARIIGLVHAGWRGLSKDILTITVEKMVDLGSQRENILVDIGPCICQKHFEVQEDTLNHFLDIASIITKRTGTGFLLNLRAVASLQLQNVGIHPGKIEVTDECTYCMPEKYFSYRRDKPEPEVETMVAVFGLKK